MVCILFFKQKTAYEMRISDWSSDVCSSDLMLGGRFDLTMVGGAEVMSRPPIALTSQASKRLTDLFGQNPNSALAALQALNPQDYVLPVKGWAHRLTGRTMRDHMEETATEWHISRAAPDAWALKRHQRAVAGWTHGFFHQTSEKPRVGKKRV